MDTTEQPKKLTFKERWLLEDIKCEHCGTVTHRQRGITRQNIKRLLVPRWDMNEVLITIMIIMVLFLAYAYINETKTCRDWVKPMFEGTKDVCLMVCSNRCELAFQPQLNPYLNLTNWNNWTIMNETTRST